MINDLAVILAVRAKLLGLVFASTGVTTLTAVGNGFTRATGSFVTDGFVRGMEVVPTGFANNTPAVLESVAATTLTIRGTRPAEAAAAGRSLTVGMPPLFNYENRGVKPVDGRWFADEDYLPGVLADSTIGTTHDLEYWPAYVLKLEGIADVGIDAAFKVTRSILQAFPPFSDVGVVEGRALKVRSSPAPFRGQLLNTEAGKFEVAVTIPLTLRVQNTV